MSSIMQDRHPISEFMSRLEGWHSRWEARQQRIEAAQREARGGTFIQPTPRKARSRFIGAEEARRMLPVNAHRVGKYPPHIRAFLRGVIAGRVCGSIYAWAKNDPGCRADGINPELISSAIHRWRDTAEKAQ
jgi:hypothetical protein